MKKTIAAVLLGTMLLGTAANAEVLSPWAVSELESANSAGLLPESIVTDELSGSITREEFCDIVMNLYRIMGAEVPNEVKAPFTDTDSYSVKLAYTLGVIDGKTPTRFYPNDSITRQEMAKLVMRTINAADKDAHVTDEEMQRLWNFEDSSLVDSWATADLAKSVKYEVINGVSERRLAPRGNATREQAIAIVNRAYNAFCEEKVMYQRPKITDLSDGQTVSDKLTFSWTALKEAKSYTVIVKGASGDMVFTAKNNSIDLSDKKLTYNREYSVIVGAVIDDSTVVYSDRVTFYFGTSKEPVDVLTSIEERYNRVFPEGQAFLDKDSADANMQTVTVPVWQLHADGRKTSSKLSLVVNRSLADEVVNIFTEIYNDPEQFPMKNVGGYSWRTTAFGSVSQHSYGTCVDINYDENYYCYPSGEAITGSLWQPYENPFSITPTGSVVRAFKRYGWTWGGDWTSLKDYMHFSYLGK